MVFLGFPKFSFFFPPFFKWTVSLQDSAMGQKIHCNVHMYTSWPDPDSANSDLPHHQMYATTMLSGDSISVLWYCPVTGLNYLKVSWNLSLEVEFEFPSLQELNCFLISLKNVSRKFILGKKTALIYNFPSNCSQGPVPHKAEAACGHQQAREPFWSFHLLPCSSQVLNRWCSCEVSLLVCPPATAAFSLLLPFLDSWANLHHLSFNGSVI